MIRKIGVDITEPAIAQTTDVVYGHLDGFCGTQYIPLRMSILRRRDDCFIEDPEKIKLRPVLVFLCGGSWISTDHNAWLPELYSFVRKGYVVASVEYPVRASTRFQEQAASVRKAIDFLRENADRYHIDPEKMFIGGESAGAYLASYFAAENQNGRIGGCISWYPPTLPERVYSPSLRDLGITDRVPADMNLPIDTFDYPDITKLVTVNSAPNFIIHGDADDLVSPQNGRDLYDAWEAAGVRADLLLIEGAGHGDDRCFQPEVMEHITAFLQNL